MTQHGEWLIEVKKYNNKKSSRYSKKQKSYLNNDEINEFAGKHQNKTTILLENNKLKLTILKKPYRIKITILQKGRNVYVSEKDL